MILTSLHLARSPWSSSLVETLLHNLHCAVPRSIIIIFVTIFHSFSQPSYSSLEGYTGQFETPVAWGISDTTLSLQFNHHYNDSNYNRPYNATIILAPIPFTEVGFRYAFGDLSFNAKAFYDYTWKSSLSSKVRWRMGAAIGRQDVWGGQPFFRTNYGVLSAALLSKHVALTPSVGWGTGTDNPNRSEEHLKGWFWATELRAWYWHWNTLSLIYEFDTHDHNLGTRAVFAFGKSGVSRPELVLSAKSGLKNPDLEGGLELQLPLGRPAFQRSNPLLRTDSGESVVRLELSPTATSFLGTEVGLLDYQLFLRSDVFVNIMEHIKAASRFSTSLYYTENLDEEKRFAPYREEDGLAWEASALAFDFSPAAGVKGLTQTGFTYGVFPFIFQELAMHDPDTVWFGGASAGQFWDVGIDNEPGEDTENHALYSAWIGVNTGFRGIYCVLDAGKYWFGDHAWRFEVGRRLGALTYSARVIRAYDKDWVEDHFLEGRLTWTFNTSGVGNHYLKVAPGKTWEHGLRTRISEYIGDYNSLGTSVAKEPPMLFTVRPER